MHISRTCGWSLDVRPIYIIHRKNNTRMCLLLLLSLRSQKQWDWFNLTQQWKYSRSNHKNSMNPTLMTFYHFGNCHMMSSVRLLSFLGGRAMWQIYTQRWMMRVWEWEKRIIPYCLRITELNLHWKYLIDSLSMLIDVIHVPCLTLITKQFVFIICIRNLQKQYHYNCFRNIPLVLWFVVIVVCCFLPFKVDFPDQSMKSGFICLCF